MKLDLSDSLAGFEGAVKKTEIKGREK